MEANISCEFKLCKMEDSMNLKDKTQVIIGSRARWALLVAVLLVGVALGLLLAPARASHVVSHVPLEFAERVELGDPGKHDALFAYCDGGFRVWVATAPNGSPSVYAESAGGMTNCLPPSIIRKP